MPHLPTTLLRRTQLVYVVLGLVWALILAWQVAEHRRVTQAARTALIDRSRDIATTLGLVIRSQRRFGGVVSQERVESALAELVKSGGMHAVALLNAAGEIVASAGTRIDFDRTEMVRAGERWDAKSVTLINLIDLGANVARDGGTNRPTIVLPRTDGPPFPTSETRDRTPRPGAASGDSNAVATATSPSGGANPPPPDRSDRARAARVGRPFGMSEDEYKDLLERRGLHSLVIALPTEPFSQTCRQDLWMRSLIGCLASVSVVGLGLAWRNVAKSSELQLRLMRASELNTHLKEMNLAAAGLAHETRNPLNMIRGLAHVISRETAATPDIRGRAREIIDGTDRVTAQLNEFINYSRPREVRRTAVKLRSAVQEVVRALTHDLEEKQIRLRASEESLTIEADEQLLRQALFNLLMNAIQAVEPGGAIEVSSSKIGAREAALEIRDDGRGVPPEHQLDIFKPYFTTQEKGTGLGLAVVQHIVLAHGWEIECVSNMPRGAIFRISHLSLSPRSSDNGS